MEFVANEGKNVDITVNGVTYMRHAIKTHFVKQGEDYIEIFRKYVLPLYEEGDIVSSSEKIIALCQGRVVKREELKIGFWAKFLSKFASHPDTGVGVGETIKMQYAITKVGLPRVLWARRAFSMRSSAARSRVLTAFMTMCGASTGILVSRIPRTPRAYATRSKRSSVCPA